MNLIHVPEPAPDLARVRVFGAILLLGIVALVARLWFLQIVEGDDLFAASEINRIRLIRNVAPRGLIEDSSGHILATNRSQIVVSVVPAEIRGTPDIIDRLAALIEIPASEIEEIVRDNTVNENEPVRVAEDIGIDLATRIEEQRLSLPGVTIGSEPVRSYPDGPLLGHVLGQMGQISREELQQRAKREPRPAADSADIAGAVPGAGDYHPGDYCGKLGLEQAYDAQLRGRDGGRKIEVDAHGRMRRELESVAPVPGARMTLSIDRGLQDVAYRELSRLTNSGLPGAAVALDPRTGAVLALASTPSYDPNLWVQGIRKTDYKRYLDDPRKPLINRAVATDTAPGSTFKIVTASAGLETGTVTENTTFYCSGSIRLGHWTKRCHKAGGHGAVNTPRALAESCDVFFYRLGQLLGPDQMAAFARRFGLGHKTGIDLSQVERAGFVPDPAWKLKRFHQAWVGGDTVDYAIGQSSLQCTPLQMCNIASAIANGGTLYRPQLVRSISTYGQDRIAHETMQMRPAVVKRIRLSAETLRVVREGMERVMEPGGTAAACALPGIRSAGKTGTAQHREHGEMRNSAWFVGYAPADDPRIAVCVYVENGGHGGARAGPIARKMLAQYLGVKLPATSGGEAHATD
jgi:penicillin-binding protein 2